MKRKQQRPWPAIFVGIYNTLLLLLFFFGMMTQESSEGFGFLPLFGFTLPWSWLTMWLFNKDRLLDRQIPGVGTFSLPFLVCNVLSGSANSWILYTLLRHRQKKLAEDEAWEQARRTRQ